MTSFEDIKKYLPQYLSDSDAKQLFSALKDFPNNIDERFYSNYSLDDNILYQGDCLKDIPAFYLPKSKNLDEAVAFFDYTNSFDINYIDRESLKERRLVSLSNYGFYILLLKLSIHFTRVQEKVERN